MSEYVAVIGGSEVGRDHFSFPVEDDSDGILTGLPIALVVCYVWKVVEIGGVAPPGEGPMFYAANPDDDSPLSDESELTLLPYGYFADGAGHWFKIEPYWSGTDVDCFATLLIDDNGELEATGSFDDAFAFDYDVEFGVSYGATPVEFWPHKTPDGDPVYDTSTGERINDSTGFADTFQPITEEQGGVPAELNVRTDGSPWIELV